jgi:signal transduction histidine kinase
VRELWIRDRRPGWADLVLALAVGALVSFNGLTEIGPVGVDRRPFDLLAGAIVLLTIAALLVRRQFPVPAATLALGTTFAWFLAGYHGRAILVVPVVVCVTLTVVLGRWWGVATGALIAVSGTVVIRAIFEGREADAYTVNALLLSVSSVAIGEAIRYYVAWRKEMLERVARAERDRDAEAARLVNEERLRIAYEVHDVVAHTIASISVQAGVAAHVIDRRPEKAKEALEAIKKTSTEALRELRGVVGALRSDGAEPRSPSLGRLPELTGMVEAAGVRAELSVTGEATALPAAVELAAYRIVQEALTNVVRHAKASKVTIELVYQPDFLRITVEDDGTGDGLAENGGNGLAGMRERARTLGGRLDTGRAATGFRVACELPR